jgi:hypothetical protein
LGAITLAGGTLGSHFATEQNNVDISDTGGFLPAGLLITFSRGVFFVLHLIDFLERCGQDPELRHAPADAMEVIVRGLALDPALRTAILDKDQRALEALLGADSNVCCMVHKEDEEEEEEEHEGEEEEEEEGGEDEAVLDSEVRARRSVDRAA